MRMSALAPGDKRLPSLSPDTHLRLPPILHHAARRALLPFPRAPRPAPLLRPPDSGFQAAHLQTPPRMPGRWSAAFGVWPPSDVPDTALGSINTYFLGVEQMPSHL